MAKKFEIRNSTSEFLIFQIEGKENGGDMSEFDEYIVHDESGEKEKSDAW